MGAKSLQFRAEEQEPAKARPVDRLDAEPVADEVELAPTRRLSIIISSVNLLIALGILFCGALLSTTFALE